MTGRRYAAVRMILAAASLAGCSPAVNVYHKVEGGAIAQKRQPPPGANLPYPNLADVPAPQAPSAPGAQAQITAQARGGVSAPAPAALAGLSLPAAPPPLPAIPGLSLANPSSSAPAAAPPPAAPPAAARPRPAAPPVPVAFPPASALLPYSQEKILQAVAGKRQTAKIRVCGFGEGSLILALQRARRLADALTAAGVPDQAIELNGFAAGSGGFVQLVY